MTISVNFKKSFSFLLLSFLSFYVKATPSIKDNMQLKVFIENKGQFDKQDGLNKSDIKFVIDDQTKFYFTATGITYKFTKIETELGEKEQVDEEKAKEGKFKIEYQYAHMEWVGANPDVQIIAGEKAEGYFMFGSETTNITTKAYGYKKITYKNLYPNIDVEYFFHPVEGIKYNIILHPGANPNVVQMKYTSHKKLDIDFLGNLHIGVKEQQDIIDHAPVTYLQNNINEKITSSYVINKNTVSFNIGNYDNSQTLVIDPWTTNPSFLGNNKAFNIHKDAANNLYVSGGTSPYYLRKFSPLGAFIWSFTMPNSSTYNMDHVVDPAGNSYLCYGAWLGNKTTKVSNAGVQIYNNIAAHGSTAWSNGEAYELTYNCKTNRLYSSGFFYFGNYQLATNNVNVWEQNQTNGNQFSHVNANTALAIEVRSMESDDNGDVYVLSTPVGVNQLGNRLIKLTPNLAVIWNINVGYNLNESSNAYYPNSYSQMNGIAIGCFVYTCDGLTLNKWDKTTGAAIGAPVNVPGGSSYLTSGLIVDPCGDVYVGTNTGVYKYNQNLVLQSNAPTPSIVYDLCLGNIPGEIIAVGNGFMNSINMNVCSTISITSTFTPPTCGNCDAIASATSNACGITYSWSTGPTTPTIGGLCPGTYTCFLVSGCSATSIFTTVVIPNAGNGFTVNATTSTITCLIPNATVTINSIVGSAGPFTLAEGSSTITTNMNPVYNINNVTAGTHTYVITNAAGCNVIYTITVPTNTVLPNVAIVPPASLSCSLTNVTLVGSSTTAAVSFSWTSGPLTANYNVTNPNTYTLTVTNPVNGCKSSTSAVVGFINTLTLTASGSSVLCNGGNSGSATVTPTGGSGNYSYTWTPSAQSISVAANLSAQIYTVSVKDISNSCTNTQTVLIIQPTALTLIPAASSPTACAGTNITLTAIAGGGMGAFTYTWLPSNTVSSSVAVNEPIGGNYTYTVNSKDANNCLVANTISVTFIANPNLNTVGASICIGSTATISASGASNYLWNPGSLVGSNVTVAPLVTTTYTVLGSNGLCTGTAIAIVNVNALPTPTITSNSPICDGTQLTLSALGGVSYNWSGPFGFSANTQNTSITNVVLTNAGPYTITVVDAFGCVGSAVTYVIVNPSPTLIVTPLTPTICYGSSTPLNANGNATSYSWSPAATLNSSTGNVVIANPLVTTNYVIVGTLNSCTAAVTRQVQVIDLPTLQATVDKPVICAGQIAKINANGASNYQWSPSIGLNNANSNFVLANPGTSMNYVLTGNNGVCTASLVVPIIVLPNPVLSLSTNNNKICQGSSTSIFAFGAQNYAWSPTVNVNFTSPSIGLVTPNATTNYTITGYNISGSVTCLMTQELTIIVVPQATAAVSNSVEICAGETVRLTSSGANTYYWYPEKGLDNAYISNPYASPLSTTVYSVKVSYEGFCGMTSTVLVKVNPLPKVEAGVDYIVNLDEPMYLNATGTGTLTWIYGEEILCKVCPNSQIMPKKSGCYKVQAVDNSGCKAIDEMCVEVTTSYNIYIPNTFTPNDDGINETFMVYGTGISSIELIIFDRWGAKLFTSTEQSKGWDGTYKGEVSKQDVYTYLVNFQALDGKKHTKTGHVTLLK